MPARYQGRRLPAVLYAYPFDFVVALTCIITAIRILFEPAAMPSSIQDLPEILGLCYRVMLLVAGLLILGGLLRWSHRWASSMEQSGMWLSCTAFAAYGATAMLSGSTPRATLVVILLLSVSIGCGVRARALAIDASAQLQALREAPRKDEPGA